METLEIIVFATLGVAMLAAFFFVGHAQGEYREAKRASDHLNAEVFPFWREAVDGWVEANSKNSDLQERIGNQRREINKLEREKATLTERNRVYAKQINEYEQNDDPVASWAMTEEAQMNVRARLSQAEQDIDELQQRRAAQETLNVGLCSRDDNQGDWLSRLERRVDAQAAQLAEMVPAVSDLKRDVSGLEKREAGFVPAFADPSVGPGMKA